MTKILQQKWKPKKFTVPTKYEKRAYGEYYPTKIGKRRCEHTYTERYLGEATYIVDWVSRGGDKYRTCVNCRTTWKDGVRISEGGQILRGYEVVEKE